MTPQNEVLQPSAQDYWVALEAMMTANRAGNEDAFDDCIHKLDRIWYALSSEDRALVEGKPRSQATKCHSAA